MSKSTYCFLFVCFVFVLVKIFSVSYSNLNLFGDEAQYWVWSKNFEFGYFSKPPLLPWVIGLVTSVFGNSFFVLKMIPLFTYCLTSLIVFFISKNLVDDVELAFVTSFSFFLMPSVTFSSFFVSTDVFLIFFWSLSLLQILKIKKSPTTINFVLLGIFVGMSFLAKYAAIYFILCLVLLTIEKEMRLIFLNNKIKVFWFFLIVATILAPNLLWNAKNGWVTFGHTAHNADLSRAGLKFAESLKFLGSQILMVGPLLVLYFFYIFKKNIFNTFNARFLLIFSLPIFFLIFSESLLVRANANWAAVALVSFLILFVHASYRLGKNILVCNNILNLAFGLFFFLLIAQSYGQGPFKKINNIETFAKSLLNVGKNQAEVFVIEDRMLFSNLKYYLREGNYYFFSPHSPKKKISHHFQISDPLPENFDKSFIFLGDIKQIFYLKNNYTFKHIKKISVKFKSEPINIYEVSF